MYIYIYIASPQNGGGSYGDELRAGAGTKKEAPLTKFDPFLFRSNERPMKLTIAIEFLDCQKLWTLLSPKHWKRWVGLRGSAKTPWNYPINTSNNLCVEDNFPLKRRNLVGASCWFQWSKGEIGGCSKTSSLERFRKRSLKRLPPPWVEVWPTCCWDQILWPGGGMSFHFSMSTVQVSLFKHCLVFSSYPFDFDYMGIQIGTNMYLEPSKIYV